MPTPIPFPTSLTQTGVSNSGAINVTLVYESLYAALWAMETVSESLLQVPERAKLRFSAWNFSSLENPDRYSEATTATMDSDLIVITAFSRGLCLLPITIETWLGKCLTRRRRSDASVAALFGRPDFPDGSNSPRLQAVQRLAREAGCEFIAPFARDAVVSVA